MKESIQLVQTETQKQLVSRETYLAFRAAWRASYQSASHTIRELKNARKTTHRRPSADPVYQAMSPREAVETLASAQARARDLLAELNAQKARAEASWLEDRKFSPQELRAYKLRLSIQYSHKISLIHTKHAATWTRRAERQEAMWGQVQREINPTAV